MAIIYSCVFAAIKPYNLKVQAAFFSVSAAFLATYLAAGLV